LLSHSIGAVIFDLDDTLYDRSRAFRDWAAWLAGARLGLTDLSERRRAVEFLVALDAYGYGAKEAMARTIQEQYPACSPEVGSLVLALTDQLLPYITLELEPRSLLERLRAAGVPFGIVSNGSARQLRKIEKLGLHEQAACIFISEPFGHRKPDGRIFLAACPA
jgi:putative hydrolase of the HAD superfamily